MKAEITPDVIQDLLPLYLSGEVSADTATLVEAYLKSDPALAELVRRAASNGVLKEVPMPLRKEVAMEAYKDARRSMALKTIGIAAIVALTVLFLMTFLPVVFLFVFK
jgi:anti-sigma factor RsiW